jgi:hypothetical protein
MDSIYRQSKRDSFGWFDSETYYALVILIQSDGPRNSMQTNQLIKVNLGYPKCIHGLLEGYKMGHLWKPVNNNKNRVNGLLGTR